MNYIIYKTTNLINNKFYIGKHKTENLNDGYLGSGKLIVRAIKKYGKENFKKEIICLCSSEEEMNQKEKELVILSEQSYNLCPGGQGGFGYINRTGKNLYGKNGQSGYGLENLTIFDKEKLIKENRWEDFKQNVSNSVKKYYKEKGSHWLNRNHKQETKEQIGKKASIHQKGERNSQYGSLWISDGINEKKINRDEEIPIGWKRGRVCKPPVQIKQKQIDKEIKTKEWLDYLRQLHEIYKTEGFDGVKSTGYKFSQQNLVGIFARNLPEFVPQNGKKRR